MTSIINWGFPLKRLSYQSVSGTFTQVVLRWGFPVLAAITHLHTSAVPTCGNSSKRIFSHSFDNQTEKPACNKSHRWGTPKYMCCFLEIHVSPNSANLQHATSLVTPNTLKHAHGVQGQLVEGMTSAFKYVDPPNILCTLLKQYFSICSFP